MQAFDGLTRLTVTHNNFREGTDTLRNISNRWSRVLSSLKSYLETGRGLNTSVQPKAA